MKYETSLVAASRILFRSLVALTVALGALAPAHGSDLTVGQILQVTTDPAIQWQPEVSGDLIVWTDQRDHPEAYNRFEMYLYDVALSTEVRLRPGVLVWEVAISGHRVAYSTPSGIFVYDLETTSETFLSDSKIGPKISGQRVAFIDYGYTIKVYDLDTGVTALVKENPNPIYNIDISGSRVVWDEWRFGNVDIFLYDLETGVELQVTTDPTQQSRPAISGDRVVWVDGRNGPAEAFLYDLATSMETRISPGMKVYYADVSGDFVVYQAELTNAKDEIFLYEISTDDTAQLTDHPADQVVPRIDGNRICWTGYDAGNWDVYTVELSVASFEQIDALLDQFVADGSMDAGSAAPAGALSDQAAASAEKGQVGAAVAKLNAFIRYVNARTGHGIAPAAADSLVLQAEGIIANLSA